MRGLSLQCEKLFATGNVSTPNWPDELYPDNVDITEIIEVASGMTLRLEFTSFDVWACGQTPVDTCACDFVKITDGDGTTLMDKSCGWSAVDPSHWAFFMPPSVTSRSNRVEVFFRTNANGARIGWSLSWSAMPPGLDITGCLIIFHKHILTLW